MRKDNRDRFPDAPIDDDEAVLEDEEEAHGGWSIMPTAAAAIVTVAIIAWGLYHLRECAGRGYLDQLTYAYREVNYLPETAEASLRAASSKKSVRLLFTYDGRTLTPHIKLLRRAMTDPEKARLILDGLLSPPKHAMYRSALPAGTAVRGFYQIGTTAYVDLTEDFLEPETPAPRLERLAVYAVVNAIILNDLGIDAVQLLFGGEARETAWGWIDCSSPLGANLSIVQ